MATIEEVKAQGVPNPDLNTVQTSKVTSTTPTGTGELPELVKSTPNPITGGVETVNPQVPVNTGIYSKEEKIQKIKDLGYVTDEKTGYSWSDLEKAPVFSRGENGLAVNESELVKFGFKKPTSTQVQTPSDTPTTTATPAAPSTSEFDTLKKATEKTQAEALQEYERAKKSEEDLATRERELLKNQEAQLKLSESQYVAEKQKQLDRYQTTVAPLLTAEQEANKANLAKAQADQDAALYQAKIDNDVASQQANIAYAKLGLTLSSGAIQATQRIASQGSYNIAKLKADGAVNIARLKSELTKTEVEHALKINSAIDATNDAILEKKEKTLSSIQKIQSSIILTDKEKERTIQSLTKEYLASKQTNAEKLYQITRDANLEAEKKAEKIKAELEKTKADKKAEVERMIGSGFFFQLTPAQRAQYEKDSGLNAGESSVMANAKIMDAIKVSLEYVGKDFGLSLGNVDADILAEAKTLIDNKLKLGVSLNEAIASGVKLIAIKDTEFANAYNQKLSQSKLATAYLKAQSDKALKEAQTELTIQKIATERLKPDVMRAQIAKAKASGSTKKVKFDRVDTLSDGNRWGLIGNKYYPLTTDGGDPAKAKDSEKWVTGEDGNAYRVDKESMGVIPVTGLPKPVDEWAELLNK